MNEPQPTASQPAKNPAAVTLGRAGGLSRASRLSDDRKRQIATLGGNARAKNAAKRAKEAGRKTNQSSNP